MSYSMYEFAADRRSFYEQMNNEMEPIFPGVPPFCTGLVKRSGGKSAVWVMKPHRECPVCAGSNSVFIGNRLGRSIIYLKQIERAVLLSFLLGEPRNGCRADVVADEERRASTYSTFTK